MSNNYWDKKADPPVSAGPAGSGTIRTRSGKLVFIGTGMYVRGASVSAQKKSEDVAKLAKQRGGASPPNVKQPPDFNPKVSAKLNQGARKNGMNTPFAGDTKKLTGDTPVNDHSTQMTHGFNLKDPAQIKDVQRFLKSRGYNLPVDGQWGATSESAFKNFHSTSGQSMKQRTNAASQWNVSRTNPNGAPVNDGGANPGGAPIGGTPDTTQTPPPGGGGFTMPGDMTALLKQIASASNFDPQQQALTMANGAYNPTIAYDQAAMDSHGDTIQKWFDNVIGQNKKDNGADAAALHSGLDTEANLFKNIAGSLTDNPAAAQVAKAGAIDASGLLGIGTAEGDYNRNMDSALALMGRDAQTNQRNKDQLQLRQDQAARSQAIMQMVPTLQDSSIKDKTNLFNLYMQQLMLPTQMQTAGLGNAYKQSQIIKNLTPKAPKQSAYNAASIAKQVGQFLGVDANGRLPKGKTAADAARVIGTILRTSAPGLKAGTPQYRSLGSQILQTLYNPAGQQLMPGANWFQG